MFKKYRAWVKQQWDKYEKNNKSQNAEIENKEQKQNSENSGCAEGFVGCGCLIVILWAVGSAIAWAWHIHWLFGLLMLIFLLGLL